MIAAALALAAAASPGPPLESYQRAIVDCVAVQAAALGAGNSEPAADVIAAANAACAGPWKVAEAMAAYDRASSAGIGEGFRRADREAFRAFVYLEAFKALAAARESGR